MVLALYGQEGTELFTKIYKNTSNPNNLRNILDNTNPRQKEMLIHFFNLAKDLRNSNENGTTLKLKPFESENEIGELQVNLEAGTLFIASCGNHTLFYNFSFNAKLRKEVQNDIISTKVKQTRALRSQAKANNISIGVAVGVTPPAAKNPLKPGRPGPEIPPTEAAKVNRPTGGGAPTPE